MTEADLKDEDVELEEEVEEVEVVLVEKMHDDGCVEKIVFASGGEVDVYELEILCDKVWIFFQIILTMIACTY